MTIRAITGGAVLTMDGDRRILRPGTVIVEDRHIAAVGPAATTPVPADAEIIDQSGDADR